MSFCARMQCAFVRAFTPAGVVRVCGRHACAASLALHAHAADCGPPQTHRRSCREPLPPAPRACRDWRLPKAPLPRFPAPLRAGWLRACIRRPRCSFWKKTPVQGRQARLCLWSAAVDQPHQVGVMVVVRLRSSSSEPESKSPPVSATVECIRFIFGASLWTTAVSSWHSCSGQG